MKIKKSQLKEVIKEVVRERLAVNEVSPPGKKSERMIQHVKKSLRKSHPDWDEEKITSVAIATAWKAHNSVDEAGLTSEEGGIPKGKLSSLNPKIVDGGKTGNKGSILSKIVAAISKKGVHDPEKKKYLASQLFLHKTGNPADMDALDQVIQSDGSVDEATYKVASPNETDTASEDKAREIQGCPKVSENHKVQARSHKTVKDLSNDPQNLRDPEVPHT